MSALRDYAWLAQRTGVGRSTLASMVSRGQIPHVRIAPRIVRFDEQAIERWLAERTVAPPPADELERRRGRR